MAGNPLKRARREAAGIVPAAPAVTAAPPPPPVARVIDSRPPAVDPGEWGALADQYLDVCDAGGYPPTVSGLALATGHPGSIALTAAVGKNAELAERYARARARVEIWWAQRLLIPGTSAGAVFALKNLAGWTDKIESNQHVTIEGGDLGQRLTAALQSRTIDGVVERVD